MTSIELLFWGALAGLVYVYAGYPLLVYLGGRVFPQPVRKAAAEPTVTIVIAAHNEERHIAGTIENKLALDYPADRKQIVVVSDGSTDGTDRIVQQFADRGDVVFVRQEPRNGKTAALNRAVQHATGELLVFADANSLYSSDALRRLAANFSDPRVGYVTGKLRYLNPDGSMTGDGCGAYMRYENLLRTWETAFGSIVGVNGGIDAVRRHLYQPMQPDDLPDLVLPLRVIEQGYRVVYDPDALLSETANANPQDEYRMRVRVSLRALWTLADMPGLLNPLRHGWYAVQLWSHKVLRYFAFLLIATTFVTSAWLAGSTPIYAFMFAGHLLVGVMAALGFLTERSGRQVRLLYVAYYFVLVNLAALQAFVKFLRGERARVWRPRLG